MAQKRLAAVAVAATIAMGSMSIISGCASNNNRMDSNREDPETGEMIADAAVVRPMTLWASAIGAVGWVVTLPFTLPSGSAGDVGKAWVADPLGYTFCRPVGEMEDNADSSCFAGDDAGIDDNVKR
ncbi:MAG: hypothetical protein P8Z39_07055 [Gammaproteobacteria bacterium]